MMNRIKGCIKSHMIIKCNIFSKINNYMSTDMVKQGPDFQKILGKILRFA